MNQSAEIGIYNVRMNNWSPQWPQNYYDDDKKVGFNTW